MTLDIHGLSSVHTDTTLQLLLFVLF